MFCHTLQVPSGHLSILFNFENRTRVPSVAVSFAAGYGLKAPVRLTEARKP